MILHIEGSQQLFDFCTVVLNSYSFVQSFEVQITDEIDKAFPIGAKTQIKHENGEIIIEGVIEYRNVSIDGMVVYGGRNDMRLVVDSYFKAYKQFAKNSSIDSVLKDILSPFGLTMQGKSVGFEKAEIECEVGQNVAKTISDICMASGADVRMTNSGLIHIGPHEPTVNSAFKFVYGSTIQNRELDENQSESFDRYTVISLNTKASYGSGDKERVICYNRDLTQAECFRIANTMYNTDHRKRFLYKCLFVSDGYVMLNNNYFVVDSGLKIEKAMHLREIVYTQSNSEYKTQCTLEDINAG